MALGGGGFSEGDENSAIDDMLLAMTGARVPKVCFVPTASGDSASYAERFEAAFVRRATSSVLSLFSSPPWGWTNPRMLLDQDLIYVGGGSTANLLAIWRLHGLPNLLREAAANGTVLAGMSAGANCWFEACSTDSFGALRPLNDGLGFLRGSVAPHYLGEQHRRRLYVEWVANGELPGGYGIDDGAALVFRDGEFVEAVAERDNALVVRVSRSDDGGAVETALTARQLT